MCFKWRTRSARIWVARATPLTATRPRRRRHGDMLVCWRAGCKDYLRCSRTINRCINDLATCSEKAVMPKAQQAVRDADDYVRPPPLSRGAPVARSVGREASACVRPGGVREERVNGGATTGLAAENG